jgi:ubiquinone/menaquinone biosynthesis C-methylase UbiE
MRKEKKDFRFDKLALKYDYGFAGKSSRRFYNLLIKQVRLFSGAAVLDVGCGTGALLRRMADICEINCFGIDVEKNMIEEAKRKCPQMSFQVSRCEKTPFESQSFDVIVACMAYHHFEDKEGFAKEAARLLKPGGALYIADPRFPWLIRKAVNGVLSLLRIVGEFNKPDEIAARFSAFGFECAGVAHDGYAQLVKLQRI